MNNKIFIGYDNRAHVAAEVCKYSILKRSSNVECVYLKSHNIPEYSRVAEEPQSTDFTFTRFWVPYLSNYEGYSIFCDCDFLFLKDVNILFDIAKKNNATVSIVKHPLYTPRSEYKMDGVKQHSSLRKNWASLMVFNNKRCSNLTPYYLNNIFPGSKLHKFDWLSDKNIGDLPMEWNVLDGYYDVADPCAIHYTDGGPWFKEYRDTRYSKVWIKEFEEWSPW